MTSPADESKATTTKPPVPFRPDTNRVGVRVAGFGHAAPDRIITSRQLEADLGLEPGWIEQRTGIRERRHVDPSLAVSDLAIAAGRMAIDTADNDGAPPIGLTILATSTPDHLLPPTAPLVVQELGLSETSGAIDLTGACAGFVYALSLADAFVRTQRQSVLVIAANILSKRINEKETATAILFADGAGATLLTPAEDMQTGVRGLHLASDGSAYHNIRIAAGGSRTPFDSNTPIVDTRMRMSDGRAVFHKAVHMMTGSAREALKRAEWSLEEIDAFLPHQANTRMIEATRKALKLPEDKVITTVGEFGNTSAASIPFTLSYAAAQGRIHCGQRVLITAAGAGLTGGAIALQL